MSLPVIIQPLRPAVVLTDWLKDTIDNPELLRSAHVIERWFHKGQLLSVLTAVEAVEPDKGKAARPEYHISISRLAVIRGEVVIARVDSATALEVLRQFGAEGFLEDNHVPHGKVRNFWRPVAGNYVGEVCKCQETEPEIREDKGDYIWRGT